MTATPSDLPKDLHAVYNKLTEEKSKLTERIEEIDKALSARLDMRRAHTVLQCALAQLDAQGLQRVLDQASKVCTTGQPLAPRDHAQESPVLARDPDPRGDQR